MYAFNRQRRYQRRTAFPDNEVTGRCEERSKQRCTATPVAAKVVVPVEETAAPAKVEIDFSNVEVEPLFEDMVTSKHSANQISVLLR